MLVKVRKVLKAVTPFSPGHVCEVACEHVHQDLVLPVQQVGWDHFEYDLVGHYVVAELDQHGRKCRRKQYIENVQ